MIDFSRIHAMNAMTTSAKIRKRRKRLPMLLMVIAAGVTLVIFSLVFPANTSGMDNNGCAKVLRNVVTPDYFEGYKCSDGSLKEIIPELELMLTCLTEQNSHTRKLADAKGSIMVRSGAMVDMFETKITNFCARNPNGQYSDFADEFYAEAMAIISPSLEKFYNSN